MVDERIWRGATVVKVGFIVEGDTEKIIIDSAAFKDWARSHGIEICDPVLDAKAAQHPACPSAKRFHDGLINLVNIAPGNSASF